MAKKALTPTYIFFFLLFWPDTWRIFIGLAIGGLVAPRLGGAHDTATTSVILFVMLAAIGYAASAKPAQFISAKLRHLILAKR